MRPTVTVGARFRWVSRSDAGGRAAGGIGESGLQGRLNQVSVSILGDKVAGILWSFPMESGVGVPPGNALGAREAKRGTIRKHKGSYL